MDLQGGSLNVGQVDGVSDMAPVYWLCAGRVKIEAMASACLDAQHFSSSLYTTGAFQAATPVLELRRSEFDLVNLCGG